MGWQCRASWPTLLVLLWLVMQGALAIAGAPRAPYRVDDPETEMWGLVRDSLYPADVAAFLQAYPNGKYAPAARLKLQQLQRPQSGSPPQASSASAARTVGTQADSSMLGRAVNSSRPTDFHPRSANGDDDWP